MTNPRVDIAPVLHPALLTEIVFPSRRDQTEGVRRLTRGVPALPSAVTVHRAPEDGHTRLCVPESDSQHQDWLKAILGQSLNLRRPTNPRPASRRGQADAIPDGKCDCRAARPNTQRGDYERPGRTPPPASGNDRNTQAPSTPSPRRGSLLRGAGLRGSSAPRYSASWWSSFRVAVRQKPQPISRETATGCGSESPEMAGAFVEWLRKVQPTKCNQFCELNRPSGDGPERE